MSRATSSQFISIDLNRHVTCRCMYQNTRSASDASYNHEALISCQECCWNSGSLDCINVGRLMNKCAGIGYHMRCHATHHLTKHRITNAAKHSNEFWVQPCPGNMAFLPYGQSQISCVWKVRQWAVNRFSHPWKCVDSQESYTQACLLPKNKE